MTDTLIMVLSAMVLLSIVMTVVILNQIGSWLAVFHSARVDIEEDIAHLAAEGIRNQATLATQIIERQRGHLLTQSRAITALGERVTTLAGRLDVMLPPVDIALQELGIESGSLSPSALRRMNSAPFDDIPEPEPEVDWMKSREEGRARREQEAERERPPTSNLPDSSRSSFDDVLRQAREIEEPS